MAACSAGSPGDGSDLDSERADAEGPEYSILRPGNRYATDLGDRYLDEVQPALAERCAVCHACTNGPCQLNMTSFAALERGVSSKNPYKFGLFDSFPTRVSDNRTLQAWRDLGFRSVLPQGGDPKKSIFYRALELGERNVASTDPNAGPIRTSVARALAQAHNEGKYSCPVNDVSWWWFSLRNPQGGMPWGLPSDEDNHEVLERWVLDGAPGPSAEALASIQQPQVTPMTQVEPVTIIESWETFLGGDDLRSQLVARYIYEHAYSANIHFDENPGEFYRIVRSRTAAPAPIELIYSDMPQDDPGPGRVYYRLEKIDRVIEGKVHVPWELGLDDLEHLRELFLSGDWNVGSLPGYASRNPFEYFAAIPAQARSRFMLENSRMLYAQFARGPICLIQEASFAVDEHFWILFLDPDSDPTVLEPKLGLDTWDVFFDKDGSLTASLPLIGDKYGELLYRQAFEDTLRRHKPEGLGVQDVWTGDGKYPDAWLTVHRNQYSVDVHNTLDRPITGTPRSVWLISYANFERMFYNAVTQYKFWGSAFHQNTSFSWQIWTRTEAEDLWASLLPDQSYRQMLRDRFTSYAGKVYYKLFDDYAQGRPSASPELTTDDAVARELYRRMESVLGPADRLNHWPSNQLPSYIDDSIDDVEEFEAGLRTLTNREAPFARYVPNVVHLRLGGQHLYSLVVVRGFKDSKIISTEKADRAPEHDSLRAVPGMVAYEAHMFVDLAFDDASAFLNELQAVDDLPAWNGFSDRYKIGRNSPTFWPFVDWLHDWMEANTPVRAALLELRVYDKDEQAF